MSAVLGPLHLDQLPKSKPYHPHVQLSGEPLAPAQAPSLHPLHATVSTPDGQLRFPAGWGGGAGQRPGAERRKLAASGAAEVRGDPLNSRTAKAMSPRNPTNQVAHFGS